MRMLDHNIDGSSALQPGTPIATAPRLVSLAILKANWNVGRSYLDNFVPFIAECLRGEAGPVSAKWIQAALRKRFGITVPQNALHTIMSRAQKAGLVKRRDGHYLPEPAVLAHTIAPSQGDFLRCHAAVVNGLCTFAQDRYFRAVSPLDGASALEAYVADFGLPIVLQGVAAERAFEPAVVASPDLGYIVHAFVEHLAAADPAGFRYLATVVEGSMLASVVYLPDVGSVQRKFTSTTAYLDTPFLLRALGHLGSELMSAANELLDLLRLNGASIACFEKTLAETRGVILRAARNLGARAPHGQNDVVVSFLERGLRRADVDLLAADLERELMRRGILVVSPPPYSRSSNIAEEELNRVLADEVRYASEHTLRHDLDALTAIDRLRSGQHQPILENCRAILVTTNKSLVRAARRYFSDGNPGFSWPLAISDTDLATLVWLKQPLRSPDLPGKQVMADCYAALRPDTATWDRWLEEITRSEANGTCTSEELDYIRFSPDAQRMLMDTTLGDPSAIAPQTIREVVKAARLALSAPIAQQLSDTQDELEGERKRRIAAESVAAAEAVRADRAHMAREAAAEALRADFERRRALLTTRASRRAKFLGSAAFAFVLAIFAASAALSFMGFSGLPGPDVPPPWRIAGFGVLIVGGIAGLACDGWGLDARRMGHRVEGWAQPRLLERYLRRAGDLA